MNLVFIISHFLCFSKIFFIHFSAVFLCDKAHENVRSVQLAVKYCGDMNLCFIFLLLWLLKGRKADSYGIFPGNRPGNGIATKCATG